MEDTIYYDENLFYINDIINTISRGLRLDLEPDLFIDKFVDDILFVEHALSMLYSSLSNNKNLVNKSEHLRRFMRSKRRFSEVLESITESSRGFSLRISPFYAKFRDIAEGQREQLLEMREALYATTTPDELQPDVVSEQEIMFLLSEERSGELA